MKTTLLSVFLTLSGLCAFAQAPTIAGDVLLCPNSNGTASVVSSQVYDSYQWQFRFMFGGGAFEDISGATSSSFTYDDYNYAVTYIRVRVTLGTNTYFSNELAIDSYAFLPIFTIQTFNPNEVSIDPNDGTLLLCQGATIQFEAGMPYDTNLQWYNNGSPIPGATNSILVVTEAGNYNVSGAPGVCPNFSQNSLPTLVAIDPNCSLSVENSANRITFAISPNPVKSNLQFTSNASVDEISIFDISGKKLFASKPSAMSVNVDLSALANGLYVAQIRTEIGNTSVKILKE
ncbi:T9SS type A sorting domain-containing protein [Flavobacterium sp.]|uniref:T9SS type A sorting domain-containing protein n=1 Tax=Flavobacterium sp. TaxID=239 RepID=UPI00120F6494|nr:T9SS type A sorting domain-containing protein [Flavobacterium sp.]RZJ70498.1 MAG: T9SS type A sorting domain-containing protein [Flavobacterium sp.]